MFRSTIRRKCTTTVVSVFDDPYAVVIDRDPRDLYLAGKYTKDPNFKFTPKKNVDVTQEIISHACAYSEKIEISCIDVPVNFTNEDNGNIYLFAKGDISREIEGSVHIGNGISIEWTDGH